MKPRRLQREVIFSISTFSFGSAIRARMFGRPRSKCQGRHRLGTVLIWNLNLRLNQIKRRLLKNPALLLPLPARHEWGED